MPPNQKIDKRRIGDFINIPGDYQYRAFHEGSAPQRFWHFGKYQEAKRWLQPRAGETILDVGCGSGVFSSLIANHKETTIIGIDSNPRAIAFATQTFKNPNLQFQVGLIDELDYPRESVDKITFLEVIEHMYEEQGEKMLKTFYSILRKKGRLVITTPNAISLWPIIEKFLDFSNLVPHLSGDQHINLYTANQLVTLGEDIGFQTVTCRSINFLAPWMALLNWNLAIKMHALEQKMTNKWGNILLVCFEKPAVG